MEMPDPVLSIGALIVTGTVGLLGWVGVSQWNNRGPITGSVIQKDHDSAYTSCQGKPMVCTYHHEAWQIKVQSASDPERTKWVTVPESQWSATTIGQDFTNGTDRR